MLFRSAQLYEQLVGERLSGVTFVMDYIQLQFNPPRIINVYTPVTVSSASHTAKSGDEQFRNALCEQITKIVEAVTVIPREAFRIIFADHSTVSISLRPSDYVGAEAIYFQGREDKWNVI